ncbi:hypothetical protein HDV01_002202 [Terramyces sp. JEL0728]|nr:hypothetical protein HDV01_002202 [Terramyces sp. JEL0728]
MQPEKFTVGNIKSTYQSQSPRTRLYLSIGLFCFALGGTVMAYKLEEMYPAKKSKV